MLTSFQALLILAYLGSGLLPWLLVRPVAGNRETPGAGGLLLAMAGVSIWGLASAAHTAVSTPLAGFVTWNILFLGVSLAIIGWFVVLSVFTGLVTPTRRLYAVLALEPILLQVFAWTNPLHHLVYGQATVFTSVTSIVSQYGPVFWLHVLAGWGLNGVATVFVLREVLRSHGVRRRQSIALAATAVPIVVTNAVHIYYRTSFDLTPFGFVITIFILGWALFRAQFLDIVPIGRERAVQNMNDALVTVDSEGRVVDCNPAARALVDAGPDYFGTPAVEFFSKFSETVEQFRNEADVDTEIQVTENGTERYFDLDISPIHGPAGERDGRLIVIRDITLLKHREEELRDHEQELDLLRQVLSRVLRHNIRNDITVVKGYTELLADDLPEDRRAMADTVVSKADDLVTISEKARTVEKLIEGDHEPRALDMCELVSDLCTEYRSQFPAVDIRLDAPDSCHVQVAPSIQLAVENLLENAVTHTRASSPTVDVTLTEDTDGVHLTISDDGPGVPEQELAVLEQGAETQLEHGSGLGLWIVDWVVRNSGASIRYEVDETGTSVTLDFPTNAAEPED